MNIFGQRGASSQCRNVGYRHLGRIAILPPPKFVRRSAPSPCHTTASSGFSTMTELLLNSKSNKIISSPVYNCVGCQVVDNDSNGTQAAVCDKIIFNCLISHSLTVQNCRQSSATRSDDDDDEEVLKPVHTVAEKCDCRRCLAVSAAVSLFCDSVDRPLGYTCRVQ